jgi:hypothetical protein
VRRSARPDWRKGAKSYTLESAYGAVTDTGGPRAFDQMIREAKDERTDRLLVNRASHLSFDDEDRYATAGRHRPSRGDEARPC